jgi:hypothetical protein
MTAQAAQSVLTLGPADAEPVRMRLSSLYGSPVPMSRPFHHRGTPAAQAVTAAGTAGRSTVAEAGTVPSVAAGIPLYSYDV